MKYIRKTKITAIGEFKNTENVANTIADLSRYVSNFVSDKDKIITDLQNYPTGYRITFNIECNTKRCNKYMKYLANLTQWFYDDINCLSQYYYNCVYM